MGDQRGPGWLNAAFGQSRSPGRRRLRRGRPQPDHDGDERVGAAEPAWWLNLQAHPDATAQTRDGARQVRARRAQADERERLWSRWAQIDTNLDAYAGRRPAETAVVILDPADAAGPAAGPGPAGRAAAPP